MTYPPEVIRALQDLYTKLLALSTALRSQKIAFFRPANKEQRRFFAESEVGIRLMLGDNRSGKSVCGAVEAWAHSLGYRPWLREDDPNYRVRLPGGEPIPVPNVGRIIAQDFNTAIKQNIWDKLREWAPDGYYEIKKNQSGVPVEVKWKNGSIIYLMSDEQDDKVFEGTRGHWFWVDEPIGYGKYIGLRRGLVDFNGHCWMTLTPLSQPWIADIIQERVGEPNTSPHETVKLYELSIYENPYQTPEMIRAFIRDMKPDEKAARIGREWKHLTGRVFKEWHPKPPYWIEPRKIPSHWPRVVVIDPHPNKPIAVLWMAVDPDERVHVYRELFDEDLITVTDVADRMKELEKDEIIAVRLIDPASKERERGTGISIYAKFAEEGIVCIPAPKKNLSAGFDSIHNALKCKYEWSLPMLVVHNCCPTVKMNFQRFVWDTWKSSKDRDMKGDRQTVIAHNDDFIACIRYYFQSGLNYHQLCSTAREAEIETEREKDNRGYNLIHGEYSGGYTEDEFIGSSLID